MNGTLAVLIGIHAVSMLLMGIVLAEYGHIRKKYRTFVQDIDASNITLLRRSLLVPIYVAIILLIAFGSILLYLWQPHLL